jgi:hypothetical protein
LAGASGSSGEVEREARCTRTVLRLDGLVLARQLPRECRIAKRCAMHHRCIHDGDIELASRGLARSWGSLFASCGRIHVVAIDALRPTESADRHVFDVGRREADCRERIAHVPSECEMVSVRRKDVDDDKSTALASSRDRVKRARRVVTERLSPRRNGSLISLERRVGIRLPMEDRHDWLTHLFHLLFTTVTLTKETVVS